jgi:hypothetical protein
VCGYAGAEVVRSSRAFRNTFGCRPEGVGRIDVHSDRQSGPPPRCAPEGVTKDARSVHQGARQHGVAGAPTRRTLPSLGDAVCAAHGRQRPRSSHDDGTAGSVLRDERPLSANASQAGEQVGAAAGKGARPRLSRSGGQSGEARRERQRPVVAARVGVRSAGPRERDARRRTERGIHGVRRLLDLLLHRAVVAARRVDAELGLAMARAMPLDQLEGQMDRAGRGR